MDKKPFLSVALPVNPNDGHSGPKITIREHLHVTPSHCLKRADLVINLMYSGFGHRVVESTLLRDRGKCMDDVTKLYEVKFLNVWMQ